MKPAPLVVRTIMKINEQWLHLSKTKISLLDQTVRPRFGRPWIPDLLYLFMFFFIKFYNKHHKFTLKQSLFCYWVRHAYICSPFYFWLHPFLKLSSFKNDVIKWVIWNEPIGLCLGQPTRRNKENKTSVRSNLKSLVKYQKQIITFKEK